MLYKSKQIREERGALVAQMNELVALASSEERGLNPDEIKKFDDLDVAQARMLQDAEGYERIERADTLKEVAVKREYVPNYKTAPDRITEEDRSNALRGWMTAGTDLQTPEYRSAMEKVTGLERNTYTFNMNRKALQAWHKDITRRGTTGFQSSVTGQGGADTIATSMASSLEVALAAFGGMREACQILRTATGGPLNYPNSDDTSESGVRVAENTQLDDRSIDFGTKQLNAYKYTSNVVKVPTELLQDSNYDLPSFIGETLGKRIARITNEEFTNLSSTAGGPVGLLSVVGGTNAASTGADTASSLGFTYKELNNVVFSLDAAYRKNASWMFSDSFLRTAKGLVDGVNRPLWVASMSVGEPDRLLNYPYVVNYSFPSVGTPGNKIAAFGDFSKYIIRDVLPITLTRLNERYADQGQVAWVALSRHDGKMINAANSHPINHMTLGSST